MQRYPEVVTIQEQGLEAKNMRNFGDPDAQNYIQERENKFGAFRSPGDRQERDRKGEKTQENIRKKCMKNVQPELIQHFVPQPGNQMGI